MPKAKVVNRFINEISSYLPNFTIGYNVADVDAEYQRLKLLNVDFVTIPTTWPWSARSVHFRDPDGNIICFRSQG